MSHKQWLIKRPLYVINMLTMINQMAFFEILDWIFIFNFVKNSLNSFTHSTCESNKFVYIVLPGNLPSHMNIRMNIVDCKVYRIFMFIIYNILNGEMVISKTFLPYVLLVNVPVLFVYKPNRNQFHLYAYESLRIQSMHR